MTMSLYMHNIDIICGMLQDQAQVALGWLVLVCRGRQFQSTVSFIYRKLVEILSNFNLIEADIFLSIFLKFLLNVI